MGVDAAAVADEQRKLRGIDGLRVADASVFPAQISGNAQPAAMMLAEKVARTILDGGSSIAGVALGSAQTMDN